MSESPAFRSSLGLNATRSDRQATPTDLRCAQCKWAGNEIHFHGKLCKECFDVNTNFVYHMLDLPDHYQELIRNTKVGKRIYKDIPYSKVVMVEGEKMTTGMKAWLLRKAAEYGQHTEKHQKLWAVSLLRRYRAELGQNGPSLRGNRYRLKS